MVDQPWSILVVEDPLVRKLIAGILTREGYRVAEDETPRAVERLQDEPQSFGLLITNKPASFLDFAETIPLIYVAAAPDPELARRFRHCAVLSKPFHPRRLVELTRELSCPL